MGEQLLERTNTLPPLPLLPPRVSHGDLKLNNIRFGGLHLPQRDCALCLIDLDTVGPMPLAFELGDALRSWCNPAGEDESNEAVSCDLDIFAAAVTGYCQGIGRQLDDTECAAVVSGLEWVSLELALRFAADALLERYFGYNSQRYPAPGEHNLARTRVQWALHQATVETRVARSEILKSISKKGVH